MKLPQTKEGKKEKGGDKNKKKIKTMAQTSLS